MLVQGFFVFTKRYLKDRGLKKWVTSSVLPTYVIIYLYIYIYKYVRILMDILYFYHGAPNSNMTYLLSPEPVAASTDTRDAEDSPGRGQVGDKAAAVREPSTRSSQQPTVAYRLGLKGVGRAFRV